jgi:hypothetical protein
VSETEYFAILEHDCARLTMSESIDPSPDSELGLVYRPTGQLHDYPIDVRWELTRRHPYYLHFWNMALRYRRNELKDDSIAEWVGKLAVVMLQTIGIHGEPISPESDAETLREGDCDPSFLTGTVQPITMRALVVMLLSALPIHEQRVVSMVLSMASDDEHKIEGDDENRTIQKQLAQMELLKVTSKALDSVSEVPLFFVHLGASQRSIERDMRCQIHAWKKKLSIGTCKVQAEKLSDYLAVWDLREGWTGSGYDRARVLTFKEVTERLKTGSISTTANRYRSAFEMITGHEFLPDLWWRVFGPLQFSTAAANPAAVSSAPLRRHFRSPAPRPVPDSTVSPVAQQHQSRASGLVESGAAVTDDFEWRDFVSDMRELIKKGFSDDLIAEKMELRDPRIVAAFRSRIADFDSI